jgi:transcriptional regulator with XRE-family HTH domain
MSLTTEASAQRVGAALRAARRGVGLRRRDAAARIGLQSSELRNYERGSVPAPEDVVDRLAREYGCDTATLLPSRATVVLEPGYLHVGGSSTTMRSDDPKPDEVLKGYLSLLYELRSKKPGTRIPLRDHDLDALADALGGSSDAIETRLTELMHVSRDEAASLTATLLRRKLIVPAAGLVLGAGLLSGAAKLADQHGSQASATRTSIGAPASVSRDDPLISSAAHVERVVDVTAPDGAVVSPAVEITGA